MDQDTAAATHLDLDFYPVRFGEVLNGRYKVERKLGGGAHSSAVLVVDEYAQPKSGLAPPEFSSKYLAVKILTADITQRHSIGQTREQHFLELIAAQGPQTWGLPFICDSFHITGPRGPHLCFVMHLLGSSISELRQAASDKALPVHLVKNIIAQLVDSVTQLHKLGIIHTDIKPGNILINSVRSDEEVEQWLHDNPPKFAEYLELLVQGDEQSTGDEPDISSLNLGDTQRQPTEVRSSFLITQPLPLPLSSDCGPKEAELLTVTLADLGKAQAAGEQPTIEKFAPTGLRSPEEILSSYFGPKIDIWAIGCLTFEFLTGRWMFHPEGGSTWSLDEDHLAKMLELTGDEFNDTMLKFSLRREDFFDDENNLINIPDLNYIPLETAISVYKKVPEHEVAPAAEFIRACLRLDPLQRPSASELEKLPWLQGAFSC